MRSHVAIVVACFAGACGGVGDGDLALDALDALDDAGETSTIEDSTAGDSIAVPDVLVDAVHPDAEPPRDSMPPPTDTAPIERDIDTIPWQTGGSVGFGVASKDTDNPRGENVFIAYAGYRVSLASAEAWATALYRATLRDRGVRYVWAVQGPADSAYSAKEIGNSKIIAAMLPRVSAKTKFILAVGHSSGSFVAHELLGQLAGGLDPSGVTDKRVVYFDLDGGSTGLSAPIVGRLRNAYFVGSFDAAVGTRSPNDGDMQTTGRTYAGAGGYLQNDASSSGCNAGAVWCVHVTLVITRPHDPTNADPLRDYSDFAGRPVAQAYIEAKGGAAGLAP